MSTAGKVLSVLVALMVLVSIYLLSMVSQLNRSWGSGIESVSAKIVEVEEDVREAQASAFAIQQQVLTQRQSTDAKLRSLRIVIEGLDNRVSQLKEDQLRLTLRLKDEMALIARMQQTVTEREQEQNELQASLNEANARRDQLASENGEKLDRLQSLRTQFTQLLTENEQLLQQVASKGTSEPSADASENTE